jgi:PAS domain S-box-containing protein
MSGKKVKSKSREELTDELLDGISTLRERIAELEARQQEGEKTLEELRESERQSRILFEFAPDAYYLNDLKGHFLDGNRNAEEMIGYSREELIGKSYLNLDILPKSQIPKALALLAKNAVGSPTGPDEFTLIRKDGDRIQVEIRTYPMKIKDKLVVLGIARDIAKHKKTEDELRAARDELALLEKERVEELAKLKKALEKEVASRKRLEEILQKRSADQADESTSDDGKTDDKS